MAHSIRSATPAEIPPLVGLMSEFYAEANYTLDAAWAANCFAALLAEPTRGSVWIAHDDEQPAGYTVLTLRFSMEFGGLDGFIDDLFVRAESRRRGIGAGLLAALLIEAERRDLKAIHVETASANLAATALYRSLGLEDRQRLLLTKKLTSRRETLLRRPDADG